MEDNFNGIYTQELIKRVAFHKERSLVTDDDTGFHEHMIKLLTEEVQRRLGKNVYIKFKHAFH